MKRLLLAAGLCLLSSPSFAGSYRIVLEPRDGKMLMGHAGVQAVDDRTPTSLVRLVSPGNAVDKRGTIRVLVMNLGSAPFEFGPDQVKLTLADGTVLRPSSIDQFEKGRELVERESARAGIVDRQVRNSFPSLAQQANSGVTAAVPGGVTPGPAGVSGTGGHEHQVDETLLPGASTLDAIYQLLIPQPVPPNKAWGGYYVFDMPKAAFARHADQPLSVLVQTGAEEHRFQAILKWK